MLQPFMNVSKKWYTTFDGPQHPTKSVGLQIKLAHDVAYQPTLLKLK